MDAIFFRLGGGGRKIKKRQAVVCLSKAQTVVAGNNINVVC